MFFMISCFIGLQEFEYTHLFHLMSKVNYGLCVETSRPYLNVQSDWNALTLLYGFGMMVYSS